MGGVNYSFKAIQFSILFPLYVLSPFLFVSHPFFFFFFFCAYALGCCIFDIIVVICVVNVEGEIVVASVYFLIVEGEIVLASAFLLLLLLIAYLWISCDLIQGSG